MKIIFAIIGTLIGAGFASGQEVYLFFFSFGLKGLLGIIISSVIIGLILYKVLNIVIENNVYDYGDLLDIIFKSNILKKSMSVIINLFLLISFYVMIAGFGAFFEQEYNINNIFGSMLLAITCFILLKYNVKGIIKINEIMIPILIIIIIFLRNY